MNRRTRIIVLFVVLFFLQTALLVCWHLESETPMNTSDIALSIAITLVLGVIYLFSARYYLRAIDRVSALHAARAGEKLDRSLELYRSMAEREEQIVRRICNGIEQELAQAQEDLAQGRLAEADSRIQHSLDMATGSPQPLCQNNVINAVLEAESRQFASEKVELKVKASVPEEIGLPDVEVAAVLFNLADEALDNCRALRENDPSANPAVTMRILAEAGQLVIETEAPQLNTGKTRKRLAKRTPSKTGHDWGARVIEDFVGSHEGIVERSENDGVSRTTVMIPLNGN